MSRRSRKSANGNEQRQGDAGPNDVEPSGSSSAAAADSGTVIEPAQLAGNSGDGSDGSDGNDSGTTTRKQRSDRGQRRGPRQAAGKIDLGGLGEILLELHNGAAFVTGIAEIALDEQAEEHVKLANGIARVARHYNVPGLDPVTHDWIMFFKTLFVIYSTRVIAYKMRMRAENAKPINPKPQVAAASPAPPSPQAPTPQQPMPAGMKAPVADTPTHMRANPIPGFPGIVIDVPISGKAN